MVNKLQFPAPDVYARLEADMWIAYYHHQFWKLFGLLLRVSYVQFRPSWWLTIRGAYYSTRAAVVFRLTKGHENLDATQRYLVCLFKLLSDYSLPPFDYRKVAALELEWWLIDRYPERYKTTRAAGLTAAMAVMTGLPAAQLRVYGEKRAAAMELLGEYHHNPNAVVDWPKLRRLLFEAYSALQQGIRGLK